MSHHLNRPALGFGVATLTAVTAGVAVLAGPGAVAATGRIAHHVASSSMSRGSKTEKIVLSAGPGGGVVGVVHGPVTGGGQAAPRGAGYVLHLGGGTLQLQPDESQEHPVFHQDAKTCFFSFVITGPYKLTKGTGKFAGVTGSGHYRTAGQALGYRTKSGACDTNRDPRVNAYSIVGTGPISTT